MGRYAFLLKKDATYYSIHPSLMRQARRKQLQPLIEHFKKYGTRYDFDWLLLAAIAYQESQIDQRKRSRAGAVGIMQVLPKTAASRAVGIRDVTTPKNNIHAGTKYLAFLRDRYFADRRIKPADRVWFALAAYNAGPTRINRLRQLANRRGLDGHKWFGHVENIVLSRVGREPVRYVRNITKYYFTYKALDRGEIERTSKGPDERKR